MPRSKIGRNDTSGCTWSAPGIYLDWPLPGPAMIIGTKLKLCVERPFPVSWRDILFAASQFAAPNTPGYGTGNTLGPNMASPCRAPRRPLHALGREEQGSRLECPRQSRQHYQRIHQPRRRNAHKLLHYRTRRLPVGQIPNLSIFYQSYTSRRQPLCCSHSPFNFTRMELSRCTIGAGGRITIRPRILALSALARSWPGS